MSNRYRTIFRLIDSFLFSTKANLTTTTLLHLFLNLIFYNLEMFYNVLSSNKLDLVLILLFKQPKSPFRLSYK